MPPMYITSRGSVIIPKSPVNSAATNKLVKTPLRKAVSHYAFSGVPIGSGMPGTASAMNAAIGRGSAVASATRTGGGSAAEPLSSQPQATVNRAAYYLFQFTLCNAYLCLLRCLSPSVPRDLLRFFIFTYLSYAGLCLYALLLTAALSVSVYPSLFCD